MNRWEAIELFKDNGAITQGHFRLSSGLHSDTYVQSVRVLQHPHLGQRLGDELAALFPAEDIDVVIAPALGGVVIGYLVAMALKRRMVFAERREGAFVLRRGQELGRRERVLLVEDVITTGGSVEEVASLVRAYGAEPVAVGALLERGPSNVLTIPKKALIELEIKSWRPEDCPLCKEGIELASPGSRHLKPDSGA